MMEDRFQVVDSNSLKLPGQCLICGYGEDARPYIDLGVQVKRYGRLYFCMTCFKECETTVHGTLGTTPSLNVIDSRNDVPDDVVQPARAKKDTVGAKSTPARTTKPNPKQRPSRIRDNAG